MKRVHIFVAILLVLSLSFVSAGLFDFLKRGEVTGNPVQQIIAEKNTVASCTDSDGTDYKNKGYLSAEGIASIYDYCSSESFLMERICDDGGIGFEIVKCSDVGTNYTCNDGACVAPKRSVPVCVDSDGGVFGEQNFTKGNITLDGIVTETDSCNNDGSLQEWFCSGGPKFSSSDCETGYKCSDGACAETCVSIPGGVQVGNTEYLDDCHYEEGYFGDDGDYQFEYFCDGNVQSFTPKRCPDVCDGNACALPPADVAECGNDVKEEGEACDDGNLEDGDGCSNECLNEEVVIEEGCPTVACEEGYDCLDDGSCLESTKTRYDIGRRTSGDDFVTFKNPDEREKVSKYLKYIIAEPGVTFEVEILREDQLPEGDDVPSQERPILILNITSSDPDAGAEFEFEFDRIQDLKTQNLDEVSVYVEDKLEEYDASHNWNPIRRVGESGVSSGNLESIDGEKYKLGNVITSHFSIFLITEPEPCGNGLWDEGLGEQCDSSNVSSEYCNSCVCEGNYVSDTFGGCELNMTGLDCFTEGNLTCNGYSLQECKEKNDNPGEFYWKDKGQIVDECGVECLDGESKCDGQNPVYCGANFKWGLPSSKVSGKCGYVPPTPTYNEPSSSGSGGSSYVPRETTTDYGSYEGETNSVQDKSIFERGAALWIVLIVIAVLLGIIFFFKFKDKGSKPVAPGHGRSPPGTRPRPMGPPGAGRPAPIRRPMPVRRPAPTRPVPQRRM